MLSGLIYFIISAITIYLVGKNMARVHVRSFGTALLVAIAIAVLNFLVGWLLTLVLNIATLGVFYFTGLHFVIAIIVNAIIIELVDQMSSSFKTDGFAPSFWLALILALVNALVSALFIV